MTDVFVIIMVIPLFWVGLLGVCLLGRIQVRSVPLGVERLSYGM